MMIGVVVLLAEQHEARGRGARGGLVQVDEGRRFDVPNLADERVVAIERREPRLGVCGRRSRRADRRWRRAAGRQRNHAGNEPAPHIARLYTVTSRHLDWSAAK